jgi:5'-deoxynucleotidase YfbR-like HD superfamily hydrolase
MLTTSEQLRAAHVRRWHIVQVAREQSLAEHMYCVAVIAGALAAKMNWAGLLHANKKLDLLNWALWHDIAEVRTGDMPTPFKRALESVAGEGVVEKAESFIDNDLGGMYRTVKGTEVEAIVKLADLMEALKFLGENGLGIHAQQVLEGIKSSLVHTVREYVDKYPQLRIREAVQSVGMDIGILKETI